MGTRGLWVWRVLGGLTCGLWAVFEGGLGNLFLAQRAVREKQQIPGENVSKKGKSRESQGLKRGAVS
jgi:hypothetical protein